MVEVGVSQGSFGQSLSGLPVFRKAHALPSLPLSSSLSLYLSPPRLPDLAPIFVSIAVVMAAALAGGIQVTELRRKVDANTGAGCSRVFCTNAGDVNRVGLR